MTASRKRVMFVDDDPAILHALQDLLHRDRKRWDMVFALGGERALAAHRAEPFDVVVSDMRMPGMDGATLLGLIMAESPGTARIVLSGYADRDSIVRALPATHQFLSKPCEAKVLRGAIERCLEVISQPSGDIRALIGKLERLPSPPSVFVELTALARDPASRLDDLERVIASDRALAAKVLQLASSAAFGITRPVLSIGQAVTTLGIELIRCLALTSCVLADAAGGGSQEALGELDSALRVAAFARAIAPTNADVAFSAALLHDIGEAVLAVGLPGRYLALRHAAKAAGESLLVAERRELGVTHPEVGAWLLGMWGLPAPLVEIAARHHEPGLAPPDLRPLATAVHVADALVGAAEEAPLDLAVIAELGWTDQIPSWRERAGRT